MGLQHLCCYAHPSLTLTPGIRGGILRGTPKLLWPAWDQTYSIRGTDWFVRLFSQRPTPGDRLQFTAERTLPGAVQTDMTEVSVLARKIRFLQADADLPANFQSPQERLGWLTHGWYRWKEILNSLHAKEGIEGF